MPSQILDDLAAWICSVAGLIKRNPSQNEPIQAEFSGVSGTAYVPLHKGGKYMIDTLR